jgi:hypothetical protein
MSLQNIFLTIETFIYLYINIIIMVTITINIDKTTKFKFQTACLINEKKMTDVLIKHINEYIEKVEERKVKINTNSTVEELL